MFGRFHKEISAQDPGNIKWDEEDLSQFHKSRKIAQLLNFLVSCEFGKIFEARKKQNKFVAGTFIPLALITISLRYYFAVPSTHSLGDDVIKKDDYIASKWSGEGAGTPGQRVPTLNKFIQMFLSHPIQEIGYYFRPDEYQRVVDVQERLRQKNLLRNLSKRDNRYSEKRYQKRY
jgi:hypothetical protein